MDKAWAIGAAAVAAVFLAGTGAWVVFGQNSGQHSQCSNAQAGADIGGTFSLVNGATGKTMSDREVIDRPTLVYFGYTFCPDVCPMDMARNAEVADILAEQGKDLRLAFITVDPFRDSAQAVADFAHNIHPAAIGLTGTQEQVDTAVKAYRVYASVKPVEGEFYPVDHSSFTYLMMPGTGLADFYKHDAPAAEVATSVSCHLQAEVSQN